MDDLEKAKSLLSGEITCAISRGDTVYVSSYRGVRPLLMWIKEGKDLSGFSVADKVIGKAAASLMVYAGIKCAFGLTMSKPGLDYLTKNNVKASYGTLVEAIMNHAGDDYCPMEKAVASCLSPSDCYLAITKKVVETNKK